MSDNKFNNIEPENKPQFTPETEEFIPDFGDGSINETKNDSELNNIAEHFKETVESNGKSSDDIAASEISDVKADDTSVNETVPPVNETKAETDNSQYQPRYNNYVYSAQTNNSEPIKNDNNSGEYRYRPPYATYGSNCPPVNNNVNPNNPVSGNVKPKKTKKEKVVGRSFTTGAVALVLAACIILSFGAGFGGAYVANMLIEPIVDTPVTDSGSDTSTDESIVIYKSAMITDGDGTEITSDLSVTAVADIVSDSVVEIITEFQTSYGPYQYVSEGAGSGVIISENGYIITNNHVIVDDSYNVSDSITVRLKDTTEYKAEFVGADSDMDIAVLKIEPTSDIKPAILGDSSTLKVGQQVVAVGNPLGELGGTVTSGIVSATGRTIDVDGVSMTLIQTDAAVNPGNSGGGLFNLKGELVGIVNAKSTGEGVEGLGFAIPGNEASRVATELMEFGYVKGKTYIGVSFIDITSAFDAYRYFGTRTLGVYVSSTDEGYNDDILEKGDRIVKVNDTEIASTDEIRSIVKGSKVGDVLTFTIFRDGSMTEVEVTCYEYIPEEFRE